MSKYDVSIDELQLDKEWVNQPARYMEVATELAEAKAVLEKAKAQYDLAKAETYTKAKKDPLEYGIDKVTEAAVNNAVIQDEGIQEKQAIVIEAQYEVNALQVVVTALDHRKKALESLVHLFGMNYFSTPQTSNKDFKENTEESLKKRVRKKSKGE